MEPTLKVVTNLVLIRHAQSSFNQAAETYVKQHGLIYDWEHLSKDEKFLATVKYSYHLRDSPITNQGIE